MDARPYLILNEAGVRRHLAGLPAMAVRLGGAPAAWTVREVSDGNLNSVFLVQGAAGGVCVKPSLPHVRVDVAWKLPLDRVFFEAAYLGATAPHVQGAAPALLHYDPALFCLAMEQLSPHVILRHGLIARTIYPHTARDVGLYVARAAFHTSGLARPFEAVMDDIALFARNQTLTRITVDLVLTDTRIIDGEFALFGPIGFDLSLFVANLLLSLFAHTRDPAGVGYRDWIASQIPIFWQAFRDAFAGLWTARSASADGDIMHAALLGSAPRMQDEQEAFLAAIFDDMLGFAGLEVIRRIVGFAHVLDIESIEDPRERAACERKSLGFARRLLTERGSFASAASLAREAERIR